MIVVGIDAGPYESGKTADITAPRLTVPARLSGSDQFRILGR